MVVSIRPAAADSEADRLAGLVRACAGGDRAALAALYQATSASLFGIALRVLARRDLAEETLQDAYVQVWRRADSFDPERGNALAWMTGIVRNGAVDRLRKLRREVLVEDASEAVPAAEATAAAVARFGRDDDARAIEACLRTLEPAQRNLVVLAFVHGYSHGELATRLGMPLGTVKSSIRRSLLRLKECMDR